MDLVQDARRFLLYHKWSIENSPLQVYVSALVFSPTGSIIRCLYQEEEPEWIKIKPAIENEWNACLQTLEGHSKSVNSVAISPNTQWIASASDDRTIKIWDVATGQCCQTLEGHSESVKSVTISPDAQWIVSASDDGTIKIWDAATGQDRQTLKAHREFIWSVAISSDVQWVVSASVDRTIKIWDAATGQCCQTLKGHRDSVNSVAVSPNAQWIASGSSDTTVKIWDTTTGQCRQMLEGHSESVNSVAISPDAQWIASASGWRPITATYTGQSLGIKSGDDTIKIWDTTTGQCRQTLRGHSTSVQLVTISSDAKWIASASRDHTVKIWDAATGQCYQTFEGHRDSVNSVAVSPNAQWIASASSDTTIKIWNTTMGKCRQTLEGHSDEVKFWDTPKDCRPRYSRLFRSVAISPDAKWIAWASDCHTIKIGDATTGQCYQTLKGSSGYIESVAISPNAQWIASVLSNCTILGKTTVKIWDTTTGQCRQTLNGQRGWVKSVAISPNGQWIASVSSWGAFKEERYASPYIINSRSGVETIKIWDTTTGQCRQTLRGHNRSVKSVAISPDAKWIASASSDHTVKIWDAATGQCRQTLEGHSKSVRSVAISSDAQWIASASDDGTVKIWDAATGQCRRALYTGHTPHQIAFDPTGSRLYTNIGTIDLNLPIETTDQKSCFQGYGISPDNMWITWCSEQLLWLPSEYRPSCWAVAGSAVVLVCPAEQVILMQFRADGPVPSPSSTWKQSTCDF
jgi:WD40 repeat protein